MIRDALPSTIVDGIAALDFSGDETERIMRHAAETERLVRLLIPAVEDSPEALAMLKFIVETSFAGLQMLWEERVSARYRRNY